MNGLRFRLRLALWAFRNPDRLTMLHYEMLQWRRDGDGRDAFHARRVLNYLHAMPGARENEATL